MLNDNNLLNKKKVLLLFEPGSAYSLKKEIEFKSNLSIIEEGIDYFIVEGSKEEISNFIFLSQTIIEAGELIQEINRGLLIKNNSFKKFNNLIKNVIEQNITNINQINSAKDININFEEDFFILKNILKNSFISLNSFSIKNYDSNDILSSYFFLLGKNYFINQGFSFSYKNFDILFIIKKALNKVLFAFSLTNFDLKKRPYKIFNSNQSLRGSIAASVIISSISFYYDKVYRKRFVAKNELNNNFLFRNKSFIEDLIDNLLIIDTDGSLSIETALFLTKKSPFYYQDDFFFKKIYFNNHFKKPEPIILSKKIDVVFPSVSFFKSAQKNSKVAGVHKDINFLKASFDWIDLKFKENSKSLVIAHPYLTKKTGLKPLHILFDSIKNLLTNQGLFILLIPTIYFKEVINLINKKNFLLKDFFNIYMGKELFSIVFLEKNNR